MHRQRVCPLNQEGDALGPPGGPRSRLPSRRHCSASRSTRLHREVQVVSWFFEPIKAVFPSAELRPHGAGAIITAVK